MILLDADRVGVSRPDRPLFGDLSITMAAGDRIGVVGINGTGKSTLLGVLTGRIEPESGSVRRASVLRVAELDQSAALPDTTVRRAVTGDGWSDVVVDQWDAEAALSRLGMGSFLDRSTVDLSGGEAKRVGLARALVEPSDLLVLDEPTNHLDLDGIEWLEQRLVDHRGGLLLVTHDRQLLDRVVTRMIELDRGATHVHDGTYAEYLEARAERDARAEEAETIRRNLARSELAWLRRGAKARTSKPKYRVEAARALLAERPQGPARPGQLHLEYPTPRLGDIVIEVTGATATAPTGRVLFSELDLVIDRRERLGIVGPNGAGKTTLLELLAGRRQPNDGSVRIGETVVLAFGDQHAAELDPDARVRDVVAGPHREPDWTDARLLDSFWFDRDTQWAPVSTLSGGERRRLQLMQVLASKPNVLLLDEPTNDLDLETLRALEDFLEEWPGALVVVSHDRAFMRRVAADALVVDGDGTARRWPGGFDAWEQQRTSGRPSSGPRRTRKGDTRARADAGRSSNTLGRLIRAAEKQMDRLERRRSSIVSELEASGTDHHRLRELGEELAAVETAVAEQENEWLELSTELEQRSQPSD